MNELKPCPFCGGEGHITMNIVWNSYSIHCTACIASVIGYPGSDKQQIIEAWNRRVKE